MKISVGLRAAVVLLGFVIIPALISEPHYKGRSLAEWLTVSRASDTSVDQREEAANAVRRLGTNALPLLLEWATAERSRTKTKVRSWLGKVPAPLVPQRLRKWADTPYDQTRANEAKLGFIILGPDAAPLIPELARLAKAFPAKPNTYWGITALGNIGPKAFPALLTIAEDPKIPWRRMAVREIGKLGTNALPAIPTIIKFLDEQDTQAAYDAAVALGDLSLNPGLSIPALSKCLHRPETLVRIGAAKSIVRFGPYARAAIPDIEKAVAAETNPPIKRLFQRILSSVDPKPEVPTPQ